MPAVSVRPPTPEFGGEAAEVDPQSVLSLERKSVQPFRTQDEYLYAMKEDLAEWFNTLYDLSMMVDNFFELLETGVTMCEHANKVQDFILGRIKEQQANGLTNGLLNGNRRGMEWVARVCLPDDGVRYRKGVHPGSFHCRDNIANFLTWCRGLAVPDVLLFETDDLVMRKNERNVVLCLLEVARRGAKYGMLAPTLVQLEEEIDAELAGEEPPPRPPSPVRLQPRPRKTVDMMSLDEMVRHILGQCTCADQFPMIRVSEGKYKFGENEILIFVRILRNHVMVRIGGGWDTLENYLDRHDPCRCANKASRSPRRFSHTITRPSSPAAAQLQVKRRSSVSETPADPTSPVTKETTPADRDGCSNARNQRVTRPQSAPVRRASVTGTTAKGVSRKLPLTPGPSSSSSTAASPSPGRMTSVASRAGGRPMSPGPARRPMSPSPRTSRPMSPTVMNGRPTSPCPKKRMPGAAEGRRGSLGGSSSCMNKKYDSSSDLTKLDSENNEVCVDNPRRRPSSARTPMRSDVVRKDNNNSDPRGRTRDKDSASPGGSSHCRSRSVGASEMRKKLSSTSPAGLSLAIKQASGNSGTVNSRVGPTAAKTPLSSDQNFKRFNSGRVNITPSNILPSKPNKSFMRSQSAEVTDLSSLGKSEMADSEKQSPMVNGFSAVDNTVAPVKSGMRQRHASMSSLLSLESYDDLEPPPENKELNEQMEMLFEEYRRIEKGWFKVDATDEEIVASAKQSAPNSAATKKGAGKTRADSTARGSRPSTPVSSRRGSVTREVVTPRKPGPAARPSTPQSHPNTRSGRSTPTPSGRCTPTPSGRTTPVPFVTSGRTTPTPMSSGNRTAPTPRTVSGRSTPTPGMERPTHTPSGRTTPTPFDRTTPTPSGRTTPTPFGRTAPCPMSSSGRVTPAHSGVSGRTTPTPSGRTTPSPMPASGRVTPTPSVSGRVTPTPRPSSARANPSHTEVSSGRRTPTPMRKALSSTTPTTDTERGRVAARRTGATGQQNNLTPRPQRSHSVGRMPHKGQTPDKSAPPPLSLARSPSPGTSSTASYSGAWESCRSPDSTRTPDRETPTPVPHPTSSPLRRSSSVTTFNRKMLADGTTVPPVLFSVAPPDDCQSEPGNDTGKPSDLDLSEVQAKLRKDLREGPRTRIPIPTSMRHRLKEDPFSPGLKRFDSGVEINNMSPTESSVQGDDDISLPWQPNEAVSLTDQSLTFGHDDDGDEYY